MKPESDGNDAATTQSLIESTLGYQFIDQSLLQQALTHRSFCSEHNERLEYLGDAVLNIIIAESLFVSFPAATEGDLSRMRASLVKGETLAVVAKELGLGQHLRLGAGEANSGGRRRASILADSVEALLGAIYTEAGFEPVKAVVLRWFGTRLAALDPLKPDKDAKTRLQEMMQASKQALPSYNLHNSSGQAHKRHFVVSCTVALLDDMTFGEGGSRREAEQHAALEALKKLDSISN